MVVRRKGKRRKQNWGDAEILFLTFGFPLAGDTPFGCDRQELLADPSDDLREEMRDCYFTHRDEIFDDSIDAPKPWAYYEFEAIESAPEENE